MIVSEIFTGNIVVFYGRGPLPSKTTICQNNCPAGLGTSKNWPAGLETSRNCPAGLETSRNCPAGLGRQVRRTWREVEGLVRFHYRTKKKVEKFSKSKIFFYQKKFSFCSKSSETSIESILRGCPNLRGGPVWRRGQNSQYMHIKRFFTQQKRLKNKNRSEQLVSRKAPLLHLVIFLPWRLFIFRI